MDVVVRSKSHEERRWFAGDIDERINLASFQLFEREGGIEVRRFDGEVERIENGCGGDCGAALRTVDIDLLAGEALERGHFFSREDMNFLVVELGDVLEVVFEARE